MTSKPTRHPSRWSLDFSTKTRGTEELASPPGFSASNVALHAEANRQSDPSLNAKRSLDLALVPIKQVPMNLFMMYMSGNTIAMIPMMMVITMGIRHFKALFSVNATFQALDISDGSSNLGHKFVFVLGNLVNFALAMYKCHSMGLLPTHASDWLAFANPLERVEWAYT